MSDLFDDCGEGYVVQAAGGNVTPTTQPAPAPAVLAASSSFKGEPKAGPTLRRRASMKPNLDVEEFINLLHGSDPVKVELNRLENEVRGGNIVTLQNLEIKKINDEKKAALAAQFAAEATLRRVHAAQKDDDMPPIEAILAPLEAELKLARQEVVLESCSYIHLGLIYELEGKSELVKLETAEDRSPSIAEYPHATSLVQIAKLQDDNRALDRLTKSKEAALLDAERTVQIALAKASMVDDLQNKNQELMKQIEICQDEMKTLDRELSRAKVTANRVAVVVANEWKDANDKVMPVKQWLEERRFMQVSINCLLICFKMELIYPGIFDKFHLRLKVLEEGLRVSTSGTNRINVEGKNVSNGPSRRQSLGGADNIPKSANGFLSRRPSFQMRSSISSSTVLKHAKGASKSFDGGTRSLDRSKALLNGAGLLLNKSSDATRDNVSQNSWKENPDDKTSEFPNVDADDCVSGLLYDMLQKEVITLRKACHEKDQSLKDKDDAIEVNVLVASL
ncbi:hypothetical protein BHE74_00010243 [Ensete ventricosum]|nr:hypothetical protein BHE74_00010243 [Ensete ventricosum]RZS04853.1 hypothetical protein BHM03_00035252 [Ensete ventricosum]